jgi:hypothetical protein
MGKLGNLEIKHLDGLEWAEDKRADSLEKMGQWLLAQADNTYQWYIDSKRAKHLYARVSRGAVVVLAALATILPVISQIVGTKGHEILLNPLWSTVLATLTAMLIALDRFMGWSSAWMRFMTAATDVRAAIQDFELNWQVQKSRWTQAVDAAEAQRGLAMAVAFSCKIAQIVHDETAAWVAEFQTVLRQLDDQTKAKTDVLSPPAVNVTVTNGDQCEAGWELSSLSSGTYSKSGKTAAIVGLPTGNHVLSVKGKIGGVEKRAEKAVLLAPGNMATVEMTLE